MIVGSAIAQQKQLLHHNLPSDAPTNSFDEVAFASLICLLVGLFSLALGLARLGFLDSALSKPLLCGFVGAVGAVIIIEQSLTIFGLIGLAEAELPSSVSAFGKLFFIIGNIQHAHIPTLLLSTFSLIFLFGSRLVKRKFSHMRAVAVMPEILVLVVFTTLFSTIFRWDTYGIKVLGPVSGSSLPRLRFPGPIPPSAFLQNLLLSSSLIALIGYVVRYCHF